MENYSDEVSRMQEAEMAKELQRARDYNENLARTIVIDPFTETLNQELSEDYQNILSVNNGQIGTVKIPKISVELPIYHGTSPEVLQPVDGEDYATLVTCTPYAVNTHRLLVRGKRTAFTPEAKEEIKQQEETGGESDKNELLLLAGAGFATLVFFYLLFFGSGRRRKEGDVKDGK